MDWKSPLRTNILGKRMDWLYKRRYERRVKIRLSEIRGDVFWDVGANIGFYSLLLSRNFRKVYAVEPNPETASLLRERTREAENIEVLELALSNTNGPGSLYLQEGNFVIEGFNNNHGSDGLLEKAEYKSARDGSNDRVLEQRPSIQVWQKRFDELVHCPVDLVKVDVEGAEFMVFDGMRDSLKDGLVNHLMVELHNRDRKEELESLLLTYGFDIEWVDPDHVLASLPRTLHTG